MDPSLAGYLGFSFGEGQTKNAPDRHVGGLFNRQLQTAFSRGTKDAWNADCVGYSAHFDLGQNLPSEEVQKEALLKFFHDQGATVLKSEVKTEADPEEMGHPIRAISVQVPLADVEKARKAILNIDAACHGHFAKRLNNVQKSKASAKKFS